MVAIKPKEQLLKESGKKIDPKAEGDYKKVLDYEKIFDYIVELKPSVKFSGQIAAASIIAIYGGILLKDVSAFGIYLDFGVLWCTCP